MLIDITPAGEVTHGTADPMRRAELLAGAFIASYRSPATRRSYAADLKFWFQYLLEHDCHDPIGGVIRSHGDIYMRQLEARGLANATVFRRLGTVSTWYVWLVDEGHIARSPLHNLKRPAVPKDSTRQHLSRTELCDWLNVAQEDGGQPYALACLLALNGLRIGEACAANIDDLGSHQWHHTLTILGKGQKPAIVALGPRTMQAIDTAIDGRQTGPLLLTKYHSRMNREAASRIVGRYARAIGVRRKITPHSLRHSAITALLNSGTDVRDVQDFARHEDPRTTLRYDRNRQNLNRHGTYALGQYIAGAN